MHDKPKVFNLNEKRPKVLLLGNGLFRGNGIPWKTVIEKSAKEGFDFSKYEDSTINDYGIPYAILSLVSADIDDKVRRDKYKEVLKDYRYDGNDENKEILKKILRLGFDAILTTNYTYEIENDFLPGFYGMSSEKQRDKSNNYKSVKTTNAEKFLLQICNVVDPDTPEVWHIHVEVRRP